MNSRSTIRPTCLWFLMSAKSRTIAIRRQKKSCNTKVKIAFATCNEGEMNITWRGIHQPLFMANKRMGKEWFVFRWDTANLEYVREEWFGFFLYLGHCCWIRWWIVVRLWRKQHRFTHGECGCVHGHPGMLGGDKVSNSAYHKHTHAQTHTPNLQQDHSQSPAGTEGPVSLTGWWQAACETQLPL